MSNTVLIAVATFTWGWIGAEIVRGIGTRWRALDAEILEELTKEKDAMFTMVGDWLINVTQITYATWAAGEGGTLFIRFTDGQEIMLTGEEAAVLKNRLGAFHLASS